MKLLELLTESFDLLRYVWSWLNTGERGITQKVNHSFLIKLGNLGYKKHGTIYRSISITKDDFYSNMPNGYWRKYIWGKYKGGYTSFAKTEDGATWFAKAMSQSGDKMHIIIKQTSEYYDIFQLFEDNKDYYKEFMDYDTIRGELEITKECVAPLNPNFQIVKMIPE